MLTKSIFIKTDRFSKKNICIYIIYVYICVYIYLFYDIGVPTVERNIERFSDESSKKADSDSYLDTWTDSDPTPMNSSPPKLSNNDDKKVLYIVYLRFGN